MHDITTWLLLFSRQLADRVPTFIISRTVVHKFSYLQYDPRVDGKYSDSSITKANSRTPGGYNVRLPTYNGLSLVSW